MDFLERLNRRFGSWYDGLFGGLDSPDAALRPKDILRRILGAMEDNRREGFDNKVYVPNAYTLRLKIASQDERDYLKSFIKAEELATVVVNAIRSHGYHTRGDLSFVIEEVDANAPETERVQVVCRFDDSIRSEPEKSVPEPAPAPTPAPPQPTLLGATRVVSAAPPPPPPPSEEPGTVVAVFGATGSAVLATLLVRSGDGRSLEAFPLTDAGATVGRSRQAGNDIVLTDTQVSKRHGRIAFENGAFVYRDENSTNGSRVNSVPVERGAAVPINFGDEIRVGESTLTLRPVGSTGDAPPKPTPAIGIAASVVSPDGTTYRLASLMVAGRAVTADLPWSGENVSDRHARFRVEGNAVTVEDLNTPGGTFVNGNRIPPAMPVALRSGDYLALGASPARTVRIG
ncbi:MAG: DUF3662 domain-containing protein [Armatimonadetes bacterium]|nr:DUF3662 domain-containing protein [Armatimonadota bacterium]